MQTITIHRSETRTVSIAASPEAVFEFVADPFNLPRWAPAFAESVTPDGEQWLIRSGSTEFGVIVSASAEHGTVDLLRPADRRQGAFSRVLPNGTGSEFLFTLFFAPGTDTAVVQAQMDTVEEELATIRTLLEDKR